MTPSNLRSALCCILVLAAAACDEQGIRAPSASGMELGEDAAPPDAGDAASAFDAGPPTPDEPEWLASEQFSIELAATECFGSCPAFSVRIDERGHVGYRGTRWVARPGWYEIDVPAENARRVFDEMIEAGFLRLQERYVNESDGCTGVATDSPTKTFTLRAGERMKQVVIYGGCFSPVQSFKERFEAEIRRATSVGLFLYPTPSLGSRTEELAPDGFFERSWVLSDTPSLNRTNYGLLRIDGDRGWTVAGCDGGTLAAGDVTYASGYDLALLPAADANASFTWPGLAELQGVALLNRSGLPEALTVRLLSLTEQYGQWAEPGSTCTSQP
jgi:hypothetical protein